MARSYTIGEAAKILAEGKDFETVGDLGRRFPIFTNKFMQALTGDKDAIVEFVSYIPDYINPRKMEKQITASSETSDEEVVEEEKDAEEEAPKEEPKPKKRRARKAKAEPEPDPAEKESEEESEEEQDGKYAGKNAMELFKECKKRGIKAAPKKPVKYYIELLEEDDELTASESKDDADDDDDWDI